LTWSGLPPTVPPHPEQTSDTRPPMTCSEVLAGGNSNHANDSDGHRTIFLFASPVIVGTKARIVNAEPPAPHKRQGTVMRQMAIRLSRCAGGAGIVQTAEVTMTGRAENSAKKRPGPPFPKPEI
jgi:hypothetical protein